MRKLPSPTLITQKLALAAKRFPISVLLIISLAVLLFLKVSSLEETPWRLYIFSSIGAVISLVIVLWLEDFVSYAKQQITAFSITLLWGAYFTAERAYIHF